MKYVTIKEIDGITVVRPRGSHGGLFGGEETDALDAVLRKLDEEKARRVIVDFGGVNYMSTMPITVLVAAHKHFRERGARIVLCNLSARIRQIFVIIKLSLVFETCGTLREALEILREVDDGTGAEGQEAAVWQGAGMSKQEGGQP
jgi:anti-anti-sigma factor